MDYHYDHVHQMEDNRRNVNHVGGKDVGCLLANNTDTGRKSLCCLTVLQCCLQEHSQLCAPPCVMSALMTGGMYDYDDVALRIDSGASKYFISNVDTFTLWDPEAKNVTFHTATDTTISSRSVGTMKFKAYGTAGQQRVVTLNGAYHVPHQSYNLVAAGQLTRNS